MKRAIESALLDWKNDQNRYPLLIRGARQVGKSYTVEKFGKQAFKNIVTLNFEFQPQLKSCFTTLDPSEIINKIQILLNKDINQETLLFLDEIQECPPAITALRYFREKMPNQPVIAAGSLLEFTLKKENIKMPVGRIQFLYMKPLSFTEFMEVTGQIKLKDYISSVNPSDEIDDAIHQQCLEQLRLYYIIGGMPAIVQEYINYKNLVKCDHLQASLLQTYRADFGKYANTPVHKYLEKVFEATPRLVGKTIKYVNIDADSKSRDLKQAIELLNLAGVVMPIHHSSASGLPLEAQINEKKFKLNFLDIGLMQNVCGLSKELTLDRNFIQINAGAASEQFVGQELMAYSDIFKPSKLFFWNREKKNSQAEVDYVINIESTIIPVEVKSGKSSKIRSLRIFMQEKNSPVGIKVSPEKIGIKDNFLSVPLYMVEHIPRLIKSISKS